MKLIIFFTVLGSLYFWHINTASASIKDMLLLNHEKGNEILLRIKCESQRKDDLSEDCVEHFDKK